MKRIVSSMKTRFVVPMLVCLLALTPYHAYAEDEREEKGSHSSWQQALLVGAVVAVAAVVGYGITRRVKTVKANKRKEAEKLRQVERGMEADAPTAASKEKIIVEALGGKLHTPNYAPDLVNSITDLTRATPIAAEVDELVKAGNLQEIVWRLRDKGLADKAAKLEGIIEQRLATDEIVNISKIGEGKQTTQLVEFTSGLRGLYKADGREELVVYRLDQLLGTQVFPLTTVRTVDGKAGSMQLFIENVPSAGDIQKIRKNTRAIPSSSTKSINTLRLLANNFADGGSNNLHQLHPYKGRAIAIDADGILLNKGGDADTKKWDRGDEWGSLVFSLQPTKKGYRSDEAFLARLEKIAASQVDEVLAALLELDGADAEIKKAFARSNSFARLNARSKSSIIWKSHGSYRWGTIPDDFELQNFYYNKYKHDHDRYRQVWQEIDEGATIGLLERIKLYVKSMRMGDHVEEKEVNIDFPTLDDVKRVLFSVPEDLPVYKYNTQLNDLVAKEAWDELDKLVTVDDGRFSKIMRMDGNHIGEQLRVSIRNILSSREDAQPLAWKITAPDGSMHTLLAGNDDISLRAFGKAGVEKISAEIADADVVLHASRRDFSNHRLLYDSRYDPRPPSSIIDPQDIGNYMRAYGYWYNGNRELLEIIKSDEFFHLFSSRVRMDEQIVALRKAVYDKPSTIEASYDMYAVAPPDETIDMFKRKFYFNSAYLDGDLEQVTEMAKSYHPDAHVNLRLRSRAVLTEVEKNCTKRNNCFVYADIKDLVVGLDDGKNFLETLQSAGYKVERVKEL